MKHSEHGVPIGTLKWKLESLEMMLFGQYEDSEPSYEDAAGHLCDLLELCRQKIKPSVGKPFKTLTAMAKYYGKNPTPIEEETT